MKSKLHALAELGQSIWIDYMRRAFVTSGELQRLIDLGLRGATSNPSIFEKAISGSHDYDAAMGSLSAEGLDAMQIYERLALEDIGMAADVFLPVYRATRGLDGYVSLEVNPQLATDLEGTVAEARRLFDSLARPNVMIKVPATTAGYPAIERLISLGLNINVTLIFSVEQYEQVVEAYLAGLERLLENGGDLRRVASVASFFVSRVDSAVDAELEAKGERELMGKAAITNAKRAYAQAGEVYRSQRWQRLADHGAQPQRLLWASTSTKNARYPDTLYVDSLIGEGTVNTVPPATLQAFLDHGTVRATLAEGLQEAVDHLQRLEAVGVDLAAINARLLDAGLQSFSQAFERMLESIRRKQEELRAGRSALALHLGELQAAVDQRMEQMARQDMAARLWRHDHTLWSPDAAEISNRLGWLHAPERWMDQVPAMDALRRELRAEGIQQVVLLGMGGSSLAAQVFQRTFGPSEEGLALRVFDTTDPQAIAALEASLDLARTAFLVATKSGTTVETLSLFKYFFNRCLDSLGAQQAGRHFIVITDPGSPLVDTAERLALRRVWLNDSDIGGRYSALSAFGLLPAALLGVDLTPLLEGAQGMTVACDHCAPPDGHPGLLLGAALGELAAAGRDKLTFLAPTALQPFGAWVEQLLAESTGKDGKGIVPIVDEPQTALDSYQDDRAFVQLRLPGEGPDPAWAKGLQAAGHPLITLDLKQLPDLGAQFYLWEYSTAVAGMVLGVHPFNQPDVEAAKDLARQAVAAYRRQGALPQEQPVLGDEDVQVWVPDPALIAGADVHGALRRFLQTAGPGSYVCLQAYLPPGPAMDAVLARLRGAILRLTRHATTLGYGPRYLHSTGQLHKGGPGNGLFVQITAAHRQDLPIPDEAGRDASSITFGVLEAAQAHGDRQALVARGRKLIHLHLQRDPLEALEALAAALEQG